MTEAFKGQPDIATIQPERLIKYRISDDRFSAEVLLPGFWYTDFDKKIGGKWTLYSVLKIQESVRMTGMWHGFTFFPELIRDDNHLMFIAANQISFSPEAHLIRDHLWGYKTPYIFKACLSHVGNSSFTLSQDMFDFKSGLKVSTVISKIVLISKESRKPTRLPDWFSKNAQHFLDSNKIQDQSVEKMDVPVIPEDAFRFEVQALQSDCDTNFHVNQCVFLKWCTDAGAVAALKGRYKYFTEDICQYALEDVHVQYIGEVLRNEKVDVYTFEDNHEPRTLWFHLKKEKDLVVSVKLKYYPNDSANTAQALTPKL